MSRTYLEQKKICAVNKVLMQGNIDCGCRRTHQACRESMCPPIKKEARSKAILDNIAELKRALAELVVEYALVVGRTDSTNKAYVRARQLSKGD